MKITNTLPIRLILFLIVLGPMICINAYSQQNETSGIVFGFCDTSGTRILVEEGDSLSPADKFVIAYADGGQRFEVEYVGVQSGTDHDNGRRTAHNFYNCAGFLFKVKSGMIQGETTVVLVTKDFADEHQSVSYIVPDKEVLPPGSKELFWNKNKESVRDYKGIGNMDNGRLFIIEFKPKADTVLASMYFFNGPTVVSRDYPAVLSDNSTWRVDDGGEFGLDFYHILAVFKFEGNLEVVTDWIGAEGYATEYMRQEGDTFITIRTGYRYSSPF